MIAMREGMGASNRSLKDPGNALAIVGQHRDAGEGVGQVGTLGRRIENLPILQVTANTQRDVT